MSGRHNHWFWNSRFVDWAHQTLLRITSWLWVKQNHNH